MCSDSWMLAGQAALSAAKMLLRHGRYDTYRPVPAAGSEAAEAGGNAVRRGTPIKGPGRRRLGSCLRVRTLNATRAGLSWLPTSLVLPPPHHQQPLITPMVTPMAAAAPARAPSSAAVPSVASTPVRIAPTGGQEHSGGERREHESDERGAMSGLLDGMPLTLRPCSEALAPWQQWIIAAHPHQQQIAIPLQRAATSSSEAKPAAAAASTAGQPNVGIRLAAHPSLCVSLGP